MLYYATATPEDASLVDGHEYEGSPGGYLITNGSSSPMEATIFAFGLVAEIANTHPDHAFNGTLVVYELANVEPGEPAADPDEYVAFKLNLTKTHPDTTN